MASLIRSSAKQAQGRARRADTGEDVWAGQAQGRARRREMNKRWQAAGAGPIGDAWEGNGRRDRAKASWRRLWRVCAATRPLRSQARPGQARQPLPHLSPQTWAPPASAPHRAAGRSGGPGTCLQGMQGGQAGSASQPAGRKQDKHRGDGRCSQLARHSAAWCDEGGTAQRSGMAPTLQLPAQTRGLELGHHHSHDGHGGAAAGSGAQKKGGINAEKWAAWGAVTSPWLAPHPGTPRGLNKNPDTLPLLPAGREPSAAI